MNRIPRIFCDHILKEETIYELKSERHHYLANILRLANKDKLYLFNGDGYEYLSQIQQIKRRSTFIQCQQQKLSLTESLICIHLFLALSQSRTIDSAIQKTVELGVNIIHPFVSEYTGLRLNAFKNKLAHWQKIIYSVTEQCNRSIVPTINKPVTLADIQLPADTACIALIPEAKESLVSVLSKIKQSSIALLIGPVEGFSSADINQLNHFGFSSAEIGSKILRTDTAAIVAVALTQELKNESG